MITTVGPNCKQGLEAEIYFYQKAKTEEEKVKQTHRFKDQVSVIQQE